MPQAHLPSANRVTLVTSEVRSCFISIHCARHNLKVLSLRWARCPLYWAPLCTNCCQALKHLQSGGRQPLAAAAASCPCHTHTSGALVFAFLSLHFPSIRWKEGCERRWLRPQMSSPSAWRSPASTCPASHTHSSLTQSVGSDSKTTGMFPSS